MALDITFLGHSGFLLSDGKHGLVIDPYLTGNPLAKHTPDDIHCHYIALTHGHADHFGDTLEIARNNDATVIAAFELASYCQEHGVEKTEAGNPGGRVYTDFGYIAMTPAFHSSSLEGQYMGQPCGLVVSMGGVKLYHAGDTALFSDMILIGEVAKPDIAMLPCGGRFTMGPHLATKAAEFVGSRYVVPIHHSTWPQLTSDLSAFKPRGCEIKHMVPGELWHFEPTN